MIVEIKKEDVRVYIQVLKEIEHALSGENKNPAFLAKTKLRALIIDLEIQMEKAK